jgi:8-oxo-dGTP diphosphatase
VDPSELLVAGHHLDGRPARRRGDRTVSERGAIGSDRFVAHAWVQRDQDLLVIRRRVGRYLGGQWDIPGGTVELDESPAQAAVRETMEETGLVVTSGAEISHHTNADTHGRPLTFHTLTYRVHETVKAGGVVLTPDEHDAFAWVHVEQALDYDLVWHVRATVESMLKQCAR